MTDDDLSSTELRAHLDHWKNRYMDENAARAQADAEAHRLRGVEAERDEAIAQIKWIGGNFKAENERLRAVVDAALVEARAAREKEAGPVDLFAEVIERRLAAALDVSGNMGRQSDRYCPDCGNGWEYCECPDGDDQRRRKGIEPIRAAPEDEVPSSAPVCVPEQGGGSLDRQVDRPAPTAEPRPDLEAAADGWVALEATAADQGWDDDDSSPKVRTASGKIVTEADLDALADAAECAHDANMIQPTCPCPCHQPNAAAAGDDDE